MKKFAVILAAAFAALASAASAGEVRFTLTDVQPRSGHIVAVLYTEANFLRGAGAYNVSLAPPATPGPLTVVFPNVAPGTYSLSVMHDQNDDRQMQRGPNGMPAEGWAFSRGGSLMGPPTFATTNFEVAAQPVAMSVSMFYPYVPAQ